MSERIKTLLDQNIIKYDKVKWGNSYRNVLIIDGKKYQYTMNKNISKILENKINPLYIKYNMYSNQIVIDDLVGDDSTNDKYGLNTRLNKDQRRLRRNVKTKEIQNWVRGNAENFRQKEQTVDIKVHITLVHNNDIQQIDYDIPIFTVKSGKRKLAIIVKNKVRELAEKIGSYPREIRQITFKHVVVNNVPQSLKQFENMKLCGTLVNYHGYNLIIIEQTRSCVVDYLLRMLNDVNETNKKKRI